MIAKRFSDDEADIVLTHVCRANGPNTWGEDNQELEDCGRPMPHNVWGRPNLEQWRFHCGVNWAPLVSAVLKGSVTDNGTLDRYTGMAAR